MKSVFCKIPRLAGKAVFLQLIALGLFFSSHVQGAELFRKQTGTATIGVGASSVTVTIPAVCLTQSFLVFTSSTDDADPGDFHVGGRITNATTLTFSRFGTGTAITIKWQVFEFEGNVTVQRGTTNLTASPTNIAISTVDLTRTFVIASMTNDGGTTGTSDGFTADLTSITNLRLSATGTGANFIIYWQVIEYQDAVVKKFSTALAAGTASTTTTITPAITTLSKAIVISNHTIGAGIVARDLPRTELTNTTTVTYTRGGGTTAAMNFVTYVVEFTDLTTVVRGTQAFASGSVSQDVAVTAGASTGLFGPGNQGRQGSTNHAASDNLGHVWFNYELTSLTNLQITRAVGTGSTANAPYQLVTFEDQNTSPRTFYSRATGAWESNTSWSFSSDGSTGAVGVGVFPRRSDNVVIRTGHNITINGVTDNGLCGLSPDNLSRTNVGPFAASNLIMFYQTGDILINGTLTVTGIEMMVEGYTKIAPGGVFSLTSSFVNLGFLEADAGSTLSAADDIILAGNSATIINTTSISNDDLIISFPNATLCGTGTTTLQNGSGSVVTYANGATVTQICTTFTVACTGIGCAGFPVVGTGLATGNFGPGGVDKSDGSGNLEFWLDSRDVNANGTNPANGSVVVTWSDKSGNDVDVTQNIANVATYSATGVTFNNTGYLIGSDVTFPSGGAARTAFVCASTPDTPADDVIFFYGNDGASQSYGILKTAAENVRNYFFANDLDDTGGWLPAGQTKVINTRYASSFQEIFVNGASTATKTATPNTSTGLDGVQIGGWSSFALNSNATIKEVLLYSKAINNAERIIINNYLSAKYDLTLAANDVYTMDDAGNGNFDFEVAGIGQASDGSRHIDARGTGAVRMWNPNGLANSEFLLWGHNNTPITSTTTTVGLAGVDGTIIEERLSRIWRVSETGDVGTVSISFDFTGVGGSPLGSNLRLLIDRDGDGFGDNDVTPLVGSVSNGIAVFSGVNFQNGDRFTLGNIDSAIPLPIELISFTAELIQNEVLLQWATASEKNNHYFTIQRSQSAESWHDIKRIDGAGDSQIRLDYEIVDTMPLQGVSYYRLKQTDFDGAFTYSPVKRVQLDGEVYQLKAFPNPTKDKFTITTGFELDKSNVKLVDLLGKEMPIVLRAEGVFYEVKPQSLVPGVYILHVKKGFWAQSIKVIIE